MTILRDNLPELKVRVVNVVDLMKLEPSTKHPHGLTDADYDALFTQAMNASDDTQQAEIYKQMETMLSDTAANLYIQDLADLVAMRQNLAGLEFYPIYVLDLSTVHFVK